MLRSGTILYGVRRKTPPFVVLAADRLYNLNDGVNPPVPIGERCKIVLHGSLPLAVALGGYLWLPDRVPSPSSYRVPQLLIQDIFETLTSPLELTMVKLRHRLDKALLPRVRYVLDHPSAPGRDERARLAIERNSHLDIYIAFVRRGHSEFGRIRLTRESDLRRGESGLSSPDSLAGFYTTGKYASDSELYGEQIAESAAVATHARTVVEEGIAAEAELNGGINRECGGLVDVAIVDREGAHFA